MPKTSTDKPMEGWEKKFDEKFWSNSNEYYVRGGRKAVKQFISQALADRDKEILEEVAKLKPNPIDKRFGQEIMFNKVIDILQTLRASDEVHTNEVHNTKKIQTK